MVSNEHQVLQCITKQTELLQVEKYFAPDRPADKPVTSDGPTAGSSDRDLKLALGLLLKHRGGQPLVNSAFNPP